MIETSDLTKSFGKLLAVDRLNLRVEPGELFGFLGPNGAGKTTTIKMLIGILRPTSGRAVVAGVDVAADPVAAKARLGYVPDTPNLYERLTAVEFLRFVGEIHRLDRRLADRRIANLLELFELKDRARELLGGYSHGMKQKVCLAAALLPEPRVIFLDEPTVGLDPRSARLFKDILRELCAKGTTVFMSTHILEIAERMCDRVGIIQAGRLIQVGSLADLRRGAADCPARAEMSLEDLFLELTGGAEAEEISRYLEG
ncbi:MAG: ABC transporter ATP-binding protein [Patescibacteria group bacterium]